MIRHDCAASHLEPPIEYVQELGVWVWGYSGVNNPSPITYCPYCAEKLEEPEPEEQAHCCATCAFAAVDGEQTNPRYKCFSRSAVPGTPGDCQYWYARNNPELLEPPNVKIEVSRKTLVAWAEELNAVLGNTLTLRYSDVGRMVIRGVIGSVQGVLND